MYAMFRDFVRLDAEQYLLILDASRLHKFVMELKDDVTGIN